jgi:hypothetical protein
VTRKGGMRRGAPDENKASAIAGMGLGVAGFATPAILMGWADASPLYVILWAMAWAPLFSWLPREPGTSTEKWIARQIGALTVSSGLACIVLGGLYAIGSFAADILSE